MIKKVSEYLRKSSNKRENHQTYIWENICTKWTADSETQVNVLDNVCKCQDLVEIQANLKIWLKFFDFSIKFNKFETLLYQLRFWLMLRIGSIYRNLSNMWGVPHIRARGRNRITQWQSPVGLGFLMISICPTSSQEGSISGWWYRRGQISRATSKWVYVSDCIIQQIVFSHNFDERDSIGSRCTNAIQ